MGLIPVTFLIFSCGDSTEVGSGLLGDEDIRVQNVTVFPKPTLTIDPQPTIAYTSINFFNTTFLLGELDDPLFGKSSAEIICEVRLPGFVPDLSDIRVDSMILMLEFANNGFYGDSTSRHDIEVYQLLERIDDRDTILANAQFEFNPVALGGRRDYLFSRDSIKVFDPITDTTTFVSNVLRISLNRRFATELVRDSINLTSNDEWLNVLNGLLVRSTVDGSSMFGIDLSTSNSNSVVQLYYESSAGEPEILEFPLTSAGSTRATLMSHDYSGSEVEGALNNPIDPEEPFYLQGMNGVNALMDLSAVFELQDIFINHAELELTIAEEFLVEPDKYPPAERIGLLTESANGELIIIDDIVAALLNGTLDISYGGGLEQEEGEAGRYVINITRHLKQVYQGNTSTLLYLSVYEKSQNPERVLLYGGEHPQYPASLRITYTLGD